MFFLKWVLAWVLGLCVMAACWTLGALVLVCGLFFLVEKGDYVNGPSFMLGGCYWLWLAGSVPVPKS